MKRTQSITGERKKKEKKKKHNLGKQPDKYSLDDSIRRTFGCKYNLFKYKSYFVTEFFFPSVSTEM